MLSPAVSVILPSYNHARYLEQRIVSILNQSFQDFELILLDDSSKDSSKEILNRYKDHPKVSHLSLNSKNSGSTFCQWNKGVELAKGDFIWIAESDDYADSSFLSEMVTSLSEHKNAVLAFSGSHLIDSNGVKLKLDWDHFPESQPRSIVHEGSDFLQKRMLWKNSIYNASMVVFRKSTYPDQWKDFLNFRYCGDWFLWSTICQKGKILEIPKKLNYFRQHSEKVSPGAEKEGLYFTEGLKVIEYNTHFLRLNRFQREIIKGRSLKRLSKLPKEIRENIIMKNKSFYKHWFPRKYCSITLYEIDKLFNFSDLQR